APPPTPGIPEPSVMALFGAGWFGLGMMSVRRRRQQLV
ncbi:MAG: PEP-CTERM sorting domain-containing protein, partial [Gammaproteobacteria bacterium]|nr:PEP-CTERM sorting domain-containing protein [Gammaproteobacteria bacterium]